MGDGPDLDTQPLPPTAGDPAWRIGGRYRVLDRLGTGATAEVFLAHDEVLGREVAVKVFRTVSVDDPDGHSEQRRQLEMQALAGMSHPNLVTMYDGSVLPDSQPYLVLELVPGDDLATRLRSGPLPEEQVRLLGTQLASALAYAHDRGIVHRDVKPANILLGEDGPDGGLRARLSDFGTVRLVDLAPMTAADLTLGTASYLAPEQARGAQVGPEADVYSLGLVLIEALTGTRCFEGTTVELIASRLSVAPQIPDGLPEPWPSLLTAMTSLDPTQRPTAAEVAECLGTGELVAEPGWSVPLRTTVRRSAALGWFALAAVACSGLIAGAAYVASDHPDRAPDRPAPSPHVVVPPRHTHATTTHHTASGPALLPSPTQIAQSTPRHRRSTAAQQVAVPSASASSSVTSSAAPSTSASTSAPPSSSSTTTTTTSPPPTGTPTPTPTP